MNDRLDSESLTQTMACDHPDNRCAAHRVTTDVSPGLSANGYAFDLHLMCGGYAYFSTPTLWKKAGEHGRELRQSYTVNIMKFEEVLEALGQHAILIRHESDYQHWLLKRGWAIAPVEVARSLMPHWLKTQECAKSAANTFTDVSIAAPGTLKQYTGRSRRETVIERDGGRCLLCGRPEMDGVELTLHHILLRS